MMVVIICNRRIIMGTVRFLKIIKLMVFLSIAILLVGCGGSSSNNKSASAEDVMDLSGKWIINYDDVSSDISACGTTSGIYIDTITITQNGMQLKLAIDDNTSPIIGSLTGNNILATGTIQMGNGSTPRFTFNLSVSSSNSLDGEYYWSRGEGSSSCSGEDWISASRALEVSQ
jgi:hypothetical protein